MTADAIAVLILWTSTCMLPDACLLLVLLCTKLVGHIMAVHIEMSLHS